MNRFDKPYRIAPSFDLRKNIEMFHLASKLDTHEMLQHSLVNQIPFDISDEEGNTLIHIVINVDSRKASAHSKLGVIKFLINNGANPDKPNKYNQTPLHLACHYQYDLIVEYLLSIDVNPNFKDNMGLTPFHYLLTGDIKTIENTGEILNFIPPAKKLDVGKADKIIKIKKKIYDLLITQLIKDEFPIFKTFSNTIANILNNDVEFVNQRIELEQKIAKLALDTAAPNYLQEIKNTVDIALKALSKKIEKLFNNFPEQGELQIHFTEKTSWSHPTNTQPLSLIKNGNIKKQIKSEIKQASNNIISTNANFKQFNYNITSYEEDGLNEIMGLYFNAIPNKFVKPAGTNEYYYSGDFDNEDYKTIENINNNIRHSNAFDDASSIIDFVNLKYAGGPRNITISNPPSVRANVAQLSLLPSDKKIFQILAKGYLTQPNIDAITDTSVNPLGLDFFSFDQARLKANYQKDINALLIPIEMRFPVLYYLIFSFVAIKEPERFEELLTNSYLNPQNSFLRNHDIVIKWFNKFMNGEGVASFIYGMRCDLACATDPDPSNLNGQIPFDFAILVSAIANNRTNLVQSIYNSYKPHLVSDICDFAGPTNETKIASITMLLLNEKCGSVYFNNLNKDPDTLSSIATAGVDTNVILIGKLVYRYFQNPGGFAPSGSSEEDKLYKLYAKPGKKPIYNLVNIIMDFYEIMVNKPLRQTMVDFIYLLISFDQSNVKNIDDFKQMSTINIVMPALSMDFDKNQIPSHYGLENVFIDSKIFTQPVGIVQNHFTIAHMFGLYFEGMCNPHQNYSLDEPFSVESADKKGKIISKQFYVTNGGNDHSFGTTTPDSLDDDAMPIAFGNIIDGANPIPPTQRFRYYNVDGRNIVNPSVHSYFVLVVKRIQLYQQKISALLKLVESNIDELVNGKTTNLESLITLIYPKIVSYCKIINSYIESYERINQDYGTSGFWKNSELRKKFMSPENYPYTDLAKNINTINSNFYIYYYVFAPDKLVKLSKFNYYQIPINSPDKYLFYKGTTNDNVYSSVESGSTILDILTDTKNDTSSLSSGFVSQFSIGNYLSFFNEYKANIFNTTSTTKKADFVFNKEKKLPPALFNNLEQFYKFCLIQLVIKTIEQIDANKGTSVSIKDLYDKLIELVKSTGIKVDDYEITSYHIVSKIVQEIIREQFKIYVNNEVSSAFNRNIVNLKTNTTLPNIPEGTIGTRKEMTISLDKTDVDFSKTTNVKEVKNLYNLLVQPEKSNVFILYPNDLTNTNKLKLKTGLNINTKIIDLLLEKSGSPYHTNLDGQTPIYNLIKNYNYNPVITLKTLGIDFRIFEGELPMSFLLKEFNNDIEKIIRKIPLDITNGELLSNFDNYLYNDVKTLITSNDVYGNNILGYLPLSFNISTYIVLQYLLESLINTDSEYTLDDLTYFLSVIDINIGNLSKNYLEEKLSSFKIPADFNIFIAREFIIEKQSLLKQLVQNKKSMDENIKKLKLNSSSKELATKIEKSSKYEKIDKDINKLKLDIMSLGKLISGRTNFNATTRMTSEYKIINRYKYMSKTKSIHNGIIMESWKQLLNENYTKNNYNIGLVQLLVKEKELVGNLNLANLEILRKLEKPLGKIAEIGESYFANHKFTESNKVAHFVRDMLEYLTEISICTGLELVIRRILHTYFSNTLSDETQANINDRIEFILESTSYGMNQSLLDILKNEIAPELAKNASEIFTDKSDEQGHLVRPPRDILISFFQNLENSPIKLPPEIITIFIKDVVSYFDTFTSRAIMLWQVNAENIFKYFINNYRCVKTILSL